LDFTGCLWFSYRSGFSPLGKLHTRCSPGPAKCLLGACTHSSEHACHAGADRLTGDVGWGCTLRSCQMLLAQVMHSLMSAKPLSFRVSGRVNVINRACVVQALLMHLVGRMWSSTDAVVERAKRFIVSHFHDDPGACLSIHSICTAGKKYGLVPGRWMGPYALCRAVADISRSNLTQHVKIVAIDSGGGAPCLDPARCAHLCTEPFDTCAFCIRLYEPKVSAHASHPRAAVKTFLEPFTEVSIAVAPSDCEMQA
jgi:Peptidase family C54